MPIPLGILAVAGAGAAGGGNSFDLLETTLISTNTASVTFSNLNTYSDYKHLQLRIITRTNDAGGIDTQLMRFNADTGSNYSYHRLRGNGSAVSSSGFASQSSFYVGASAGAGATANIFLPAVIDILDFANTSRNKTIRAFTSFLNNSTSELRIESGAWLNTNAVTSIKLECAGSYVSGTRMSLYGVK